MRLDKHRPHALVHGLRGVAFSQDGHYFDANGHVAADPEDEGRIPIVPQPPLPEAEPESEEEDPEPPTIDAAMERKVGPDDMRLAVNKALKVQMDNYGEEWKGVEHARKFLGVTE